MRKSLLSPSIRWNVARLTDVVSPNSPLSLVVLTRIVPEALVSGNTPKSSDEALTAYDHVPPN